MATINITFDMIEQHGGLGCIYEAISAAVLPSVAWSMKQDRIEFYLHRKHFKPDDKKDKLAYAYETVMKPENLIAYEERCCEMEYNPVPFCFDLNIPLHLLRDE